MKNSNLLHEKARLCVAKDMSEGYIASLLNKLLLYDRSIYDHSINVAYLASQVLILRGVDRYEAREVIRGALLHDIGEMYVPKSIITKEGSLTDEEYELIKQHPVLGLNIILGNCPTILTDIMQDIILHHHEKRDGSGYPDHITTLNPYTELIEVLDIYDSMTAKTFYSDPCDDSYVINYLIEDGYTLDILEKLKSIEAR